MATLKDGEKLYIVQELARFATPSEVVESAAKEMGITVTPSQVQAYDPTKYQGRRLSKKWRAIFEATRQKYLTDVSDVPLANRGYRLKELQRMYDDERAAGRKGNRQLRQALLIEAEKFTGELYTNRKKMEHSGPGGGPIPTSVAVRFVRPAAENDGDD